MKRGLSMCYSGLSPHLMFESDTVESSHSWSLVVLVPSAYLFWSSIWPSLFWGSNQRRWLSIQKFLFLLREVA
jgi:hypothetical protein